MKNLKVREYWFQFWRPKLETAIAETPPEEPNKGRVLKSTHAPTYDPFQKTKGGRVVKAMPRNLQKLKEAQEKAPREL